MSVIFVFGILMIIAFAFWIEWLIGRAIGKAISKETGLVLGIVFIICGFSIIIGIVIIIYSNKNKEELSVNINLNTNSNEKVIYRDVTPTKEYYLPNANRQQRIIKCRRCKKIIDEGYTGCPHCGLSLTSPATERKTVSLTNMPKLSFGKIEEKNTYYDNDLKSKKWICGKCGTINKISFEYCKECRNEKGLLKMND